MSFGFVMGNATYCPEIVPWLQKVCGMRHQDVYRGHRPVCAEVRITQHGPGTVTCKSENSYGGTSSCIQDIAPCLQHSLLISAPAASLATSRHRLSPLCYDTIIDNQDFVS